MHTANDGRDPFPILINRHRVPVDRYDVQSVFPNVVMELTEQEIKQYLTPKDFAIGEFASAVSVTILMNTLL